MYGRIKGRCFLCDFGAEPGLTKNLGDPAPIRKVSLPLKLQKHRTGGCGDRVSITGLFP